MQDRKRSAWTWILLALIVVPVLYVLSFGPACWWFSETMPSTATIKRAPMVYWPIGRIAYRYPDSTAYRLITWYALLRVDSVAVPTGLKESESDEDDPTAPREYVYFLRYW